MNGPGDTAAGRAPHAGAAPAVRLARAADAEAVARVHVASWQHAYRGLLPDAYLATLSVESRRAMWAATIEKGVPALLVADVEGDLAGFASVGACRDADARPVDQEIWAIYVAPSAWSRGVGRALFEASRALAFEHGAARLSLWVFVDNPRARRFYASMGMRAEDGSVQSFDLAGIKVAEVRYVMGLA